MTPKTHKWYSAVVLGSGQIRIFGPSESSIFGPPRAVENDRRPANAGLLKKWS
jgi:hypothetical protein